MKTTPFQCENDFLIYVALYAAHEDLVFDQSEADEIKRRFGHENYERIVKVFLSQSEFANLQMIQAEKDNYFPGAEGTEKILNLMEEIFKIDGDYSDMEKVSFSFLSNYFNDPNV